MFYLVPVLLIMLVAMAKSPNRPRQKTNQSSNSQSQNRPRRRRFPLDTIVVTDSFGANRPGGRYHNGVDFRAEKNTPVKAPEDGVLHSKYFKELGGLQAIFIGKSGLRYGFAHLDHTKPLGSYSHSDVIAFTGDSGNVAPHLHFTVSYNRGDGKYNFIDPMETDKWQ